MPRKMSDNYGELIAGIDAAEPLLRAVGIDPSQIEEAILDIPLARQGPPTLMTMNRDGFFDERVINLYPDAMTRIQPLIVAFGLDRRKGPLQRLKLTMGDKVCPELEITMMPNAEFVDIDWNALIYGEPETEHA